MSPQTVNPLSIVFMCVTLLICFGVPVALAIWAKVRYKKEFSFLPLLLGVVGFALFQLFLRINVMLPIIQSLPWFKEAIQLTWVKWAYAGFLCLTAGLFEEPVRFLAFTILKKKRQVPNGLSYGIGHGGIEAILIVGLVYVNNLVYSIMINSGGWGTMLSMLPQAYQAQYENIRMSLVSASPDMFLLGGVERLFTIFIQIAFSLIIVRGFMVNKRWLYLIAATLLHAIVDFSVVALQLLKANPWVIEGVIFLEAVLAIVYIVWQLREWRKSLHHTDEAVYEQPRQTDTP